MTTPAWIGLGSNLGDRRATLEAALQALAETPGVVVRAVGSWRETQPVGGPPGQGPFLNSAAHMETTLDPHQLLAALQAVEGRAGRVRTARWGERTLDLDVLIFGTKFLDTRELKLPHPRLAFRRFVLAPLAEIAPNIVDTMTGRTIADLLANLDRRPRFVVLDGPPGPSRSAIFRRLVEALPAVGLAEAEVAPDPGPGGDSIRRPFEAFGRKVEAVVEAVRARAWAPERDRSPWIVADYSLDVDLIRVIASIRPYLDRVPPGSLPVDSYYAEIRDVQGAIRRAPTPTLAVNLPGSGQERRPGRHPFPVLWPDADEPDAIVAEILATCRGIEGV